MKKLTIATIFVSLIVASSAFAAGKWDPNNDTPVIYYVGESSPVSVSYSSTEIEFVTDTWSIENYKKGLTRQELRIAQLKAKDLFYGAESTETQAAPGGLDVLRDQVAARLSYRMAETIRQDECIGQAKSTSGVLACRRAAETGNYSISDFVDPAESSAAVDAMKTQTKNHLAKKASIINQQMKTVSIALTPKDVLACLNIKVPVSQISTELARAERSAEKIIYIR